MPVDWFISNTNLRNIYSEHLQNQTFDQKQKQIKTTLSQIRYFKKSVRAYLNKKIILFYIDLIYRSMSFL